MFIENMKLELDVVYRAYLSKVINQGECIKKDDAYIKEYMQNHYNIKPVSNNSLELLEDIKKGKFDIKDYPLKGDALYNYVHSFENPNLDGFVYTYPNRIHQNPVDQFNIVLSRLLSHSGTNRAVINIYDCLFDGDRDDIPCLNWVQATIRGDKLLLHCMFRSNDIYGAFYSNMLFLNYFGLRLTEEYNKKSDKNIIFDGINYNCTSGHIYKTDIDAAKKII